MIKIKLNLKQKLVFLLTGSQERADEEQVVKAANRAKELVKQIPTFSRQTEQERNPVQVHLIVKEALKLMRSSMTANSESLAEQQELPRGRQEKVLVVDDEEPVTELLGNMLEKLGYVVIVKSISTAALEIFRDEYQSIDLVVTYVHAGNEWRCTGR